MLGIIIFILVKPGFMVLTVNPLLHRQFLDHDIFFYF